MPAHIVIGFTVKDPQKLSQYAAEVPTTLLRYQGEFVFKGQVVEQLHGVFAFDTQVVIAFPTKKEATEWYHSSAYQALIPLRDAALESQFQLIG